MNVWIGDGDSVTSIHSGEFRLLRQGNLAFDSCIRESAHELIMLTVV